MGSKIQTIYKKAEASFNKAENKQKWQGGIGILVMIVFVLSSVLLNETVQAVNQAAGNYGYYNNTYGYGGDTETSRETSDAVPAAITDLAATAGDGRVTLSWTAVSLTTTGTSLDNFDTVTNGYKVFYSTASASANSDSGTLWGPANDSSLLTRATAGTTVTGLTNGTTYYFSVYSHDLNVNNSAISNIASKAPAASTSAGGGGGGTVTSLSSDVKTPTTTTTPTTPVASAPTGDQQIAAKSAAETRGANLEALTFDQQGKIATTAAAFGVTEAAAKAKAPLVTAAITAANLGNIGVLQNPLTNVLASVAALGGHNSTQPRLNSLVQVLKENFGDTILKDAAKNKVTSECVVEIAGKSAVGADVVRDAALAKRCAAINKRFEKLEDQANGLVRIVLGDAPGKDKSAERGQWFEVSHRLAFSISPPTFDLARELKANALVATKVRASKEAPGFQWKNIENKLETTVTSLSGFGTLQKTVKTKALVTQVSAIYSQLTRVSNAVAYSLRPL